MTRDPKTMDGYVRVSRRMGRKGKGYISPKVSARRSGGGRSTAASRSSSGTSTRTRRRHPRSPGLDAARDRALNGETGGIVSWKIDRFSRFTEGGLRDLRLLEEKGARLAFVVEDIDTSGPMGKLVYTDAPGVRRVLPRQRSRPAGSPRRPRPSSAAPNRPDADGLQAP